MGARNAMLALDRYPDLSHDAMRLLVGMALTSLDADTDTQPARTYYGGQDRMIAFVGRGRRTMYTALQHLTDRGIVEVVSRPRRGDKNANYRLRLDIECTASAPDGCTHTAPDGCTTSAPRGEGNEDLRSNFGRTSATSTPESLSREWQPNKSHEVQAKKLGLDLVEIVRDFRAQMANVRRKDWAKTFSAYLKAADEGSQYDHFPMGDLDAEATGYICSQCQDWLPKSLYCDACEVQYRVAAEAS